VTDVYDANGNLKSETDPMNRTTAYGYDVLDRLIATTDPLGNTTTQTYDAVGNVLTTTDPLGEVTKYGYDNNNRLVSTTDPNGDVTKSTYDAAGNLLAVTDPDSNVTSYAYDKLNRLGSDTNPLGTRSYQYDAVGNLTSSTDRNGRTIQYGYDKLNRQTSETWLDGSGKAVHTFAYVYDAAGQLTSASDSNSAYQFTYDAAGRATSRSNAGTPGEPAVVMTYGYDAVGNVLSRSDTIEGQAAGTTSFAYDALDRMTQVTQTGPGITDKRVDFAYDAAGELTGITRSSDLAGTQVVATTGYTYDKAGRLTGLAHGHGTTTLAAYGFTLDAAGRLMSELSPDGTDTYTYDKTGQLTAATHTTRANESYSYDANGNRTNAGYQTGPDNEVLSDGTYKYGYDAEGNLTSQTDIATGAVTDYVYDYRNRLTEVIFKDSSGQVLKDVTYTYDVFNNRIGETVTIGSTTTTERFVHDGDQVALTFDGSGNLTHRYLYGPLPDQVLADDNGQGQVLWPLADDQGSVRDVVNSAGTVQDHIVYDSFGNITSQTNAAIDLLFAYTGQQLDGATGLYYDQARFYDAALGRFLSQDPIGFGGGDANLYRYVGNDPANSVDPTGLQAGCGSSQQTPDSGQTSDNAPGTGVPQFLNESEAGSGGDNTPSDQTPGGQDSAPSDQPSATPGDTSPDPAAATPDSSPQNQPPVALKAPDPGALSDFPGYGWLNNPLPGYVSDTSGNGQAGQAPAQPSGPSSTSTSASPAPQSQSTPTPTVIPPGSIETPPPGTTAVPVPVGGGGPPVILYRQTARTAAPSASGPRLYKLRTVVNVRGNAGVVVPHQAPVGRGVPQAPLNLQPGARDPRAITAMFRLAQRFSLHWEGGFVNNVHDHGGATNFGITQRYYNAWRRRQGLPAQSVRSLTRLEADTIYRDMFVRSGAGNLPPVVSVVYFDTHLNYGGSRRFLRAAQAQAHNPNDPLEVARLLVQQRIASRYRVVQRHPDQRVFLRGWLNRDNALLRYINSLPR
jgi:RHS repeat-associated protein